MRFLIVSVTLMYFLFGCSRDSIDEQAKRLGLKEFTVQAWAAAPQEKRGEMVASFLTKHKPTALTGKEVIRLLGTPTGYYEYDENPAYLVGPTTVRSDYGNGCLLVFITDKVSGQVVEVRFVPPVLQ